MNGTKKTKELITTKELIVEKEDLVDEEQVDRVPEDKQEKYAMMVRLLKKANHPYKSGPESMLGIQAHVKTLQYALKDTGFESVGFGNGDNWFKYIKESGNEYRAQLKAQRKGEVWNFIVKSKFDMPMIEMVDKGGLM